MNAREHEHPALEFKRLLRASPIAPIEIAAFLDGLSPVERIAAIRSLQRREQRNLYQGVCGARPVTLDDLVPRAVGDFSTVRHYGKNSLPAFTHFEKRFCRPPSAGGDAVTGLYGFNFQTLQPITGPGYFTAREAGDRPEVSIDYSGVPRERPEGWPPIQSNGRGISRMVFGSLVDTLRGVSEHVTVGSAARNGKDLANWFVLCREP
jgi:hypothetical protein